MKRAGLVALMLAVPLTKSEAQQPPGRVDVVQIYSNFLASRVAALGCDAVDKATEPKFLSNLQIVTIRAMQALKERNQNPTNGVDIYSIFSTMLRPKIRDCVYFRFIRDRVYYVASGLCIGRRRSSSCCC